MKNNGASVSTVYIIKFDGRPVKRRSDSGWMERWLNSAYIIFIYEAKSANPLSSCEKSQNMCFKTNLSSIEMKIKRGVEVILDKVTVVFKVNSIVII